MHDINPMYYMYYIFKPGSPEFNQFTGCNNDATIRSTSITNTLLVMSKALAQLQCTPL